MSSCRLNERPTVSKVVGVTRRCQHPPPKNPVAGQHVRLGSLWVLLQPLGLPDRRSDTFSSSIYVYTVVHYVTTLLVVSSFGWSMESVDTPLNAVSQQNLQVAIPVRIFGGDHKITCDLLYVCLEVTSGSDVI